MAVYEKIDRCHAAIGAVRPFEGHLLKQIKAYYRIGLTWSSNALEGNTLTETETKVLLEDGLTTGGKPLRDTLEALGHAQAYDFMFTLLRSRKITEADTLTMHRIFYRGIDEAYAGKYRDKQVFITGSKYPLCKPEHIVGEMEQLFAWVASERDKFHPVELAAQLHKRFVFIHPFIDGNGRLSRLLMNTALIQDGYMLAIISPVLRQEYISMLELARKDDRPFMDFIAERVYETQKEIMRLLHIPLPELS
ncbi:MAG: Fic family protein [Bacillota bacterium]